MVSPFSGNILFLICTIRVSNRHHPSSEDCVSTNAHFPQRSFRSKTLIILTSSPIDNRLIVFIVFETELLNEVSLVTPYATLGLNNIFVNVVIVAVGEFFQKYLWKHSPVFCYTFFIWILLNNSNRVNLGSIGMLYYKETLYPMY